MERYWRIKLILCNSKKADLHMLDTCLSRDMSEDMMKPRSRAWEEKEIVAEPTCIDCGRVDKDRSDFLQSNRASVLSSFNLRRFSDIHCLTSVIHVCTVWTAACA